MAKKNVIATDQDTQELKKKVKTENKGDVEQPKIYQTDMKCFVPRISMLTPLLLIKEMDIPLR